METERQESASPPRDVPDTGDLAPEDVQAMVELYRKRPELWTAFRDIGPVVQAMATYSRVNTHSLADGLRKIRHHISHRQSEDESDLIHFLCLSGFAEKSVSLAQQILRDSNKTYVSESPRLSEKGVDVETICLFLIRSMMLNFTADSSEFSLRLCKTGYVADLMEDVKHVQHLCVETLERGDVYLLSLGTILNCCMYPDSAALVRELHIGPHITPFVAKRGSTYMVQSVAVAVLANTQEDAALPDLALDARLLRYFLTNVHDALDAHRVQCPNSSWRMNEVLFNLSLLARNDFNKRLMVAQGVLSAVLAVMEPCNKRSDEEKNNAMALLSRLMEDPVNLRICRNYQEVAKTVRGCVQTEGGAAGTPAPGILQKLQKCPTEDPDALLAACPGLASLLADRSNVLRILHTEPLEWVMAALTLTPGRQTHTPDVATEVTPSGQPLLALAELSARDEYRREIMARGAVSAVQTALRTGSTADKTEAVRAILELCSAEECKLVMQVSDEARTLLQNVRQQTADTDLLQLTDRALLTLATP